MALLLATLFTPAAATSTAETADALPCRLSTSSFDYFVAVNSGPTPWAGAYVAAPLEDCVGPLKTIQQCWGMVDVQPDAVLVSATPTRCP